MLKLKDKIAQIPDFPKKGIVFRDLTPLLLDPRYFNEAIKKMRALVKKLPINKVVGIESRGFIFGPTLARELKVGFIPARKLNKLLPRKTIEQTYNLEYGTDGIKMHADAIIPGQSILIVDDLVATGGTALATAKLVEKLGGKVSALLFLSELCYLKPRQKLKGYKVLSIVKFRK